MPLSQPQATPSSPEADDYELASPTAHVGHTDHHQDSLSEHPHSIEPTYASPTNTEAMQPDSVAEEPTIAAPLDVDHFDQKPKTPAATSTVDASADSSESKVKIQQGVAVNLGSIVGLVQHFEETLDLHAPSDPGYLQDKRREFARPTPEEPFVEALQRLRLPGGVLVVNRPPDQGRRIMALALMSELLREHAITEVRPIPIGQSGYFAPRRLPHDRQCGFLLELPPDDELRVHDSFGATLHEAAVVLAKRHNRLIILTRPAQWLRIGSGAPRGVAPDLGVAQPRDIAHRRLLACEPDIAASEWVDHHDIAPLLTGRPPAEARRVADIIIKEHRHYVATRSGNVPVTDPDEAAIEFDKLVAGVVKACKNWHDELLEWHSKPSRTALDRNFLLAAAVLRGGSVSHIYATAADLCRTLDKQKIRLTGQQAPGAYALIAEIDARRDDNDVLVFSKADWDDAALEYFWSDRPLARSAFCEWLAQVPSRGGVINAAFENFSTSDKHDLARRIGAFAVRWAVRHRRQEPLKRLVTAWHKDTGLWALAIEIVDTAAIDELSASYIHQMLLSWSSRDNPVLQEAVVAVCQGRFGRQYADKALRRLKKVTETISEPETTALVSNAVTTLFRDPAMRTILFEYVVKWCDHGLRRGTVGRYAFGALAVVTLPDELDTPALLAHHLVPIDLLEEIDFQPSIEELARGWRTLLSAPADASGPNVQAALDIWLEAAHKQPTLRPIILDVLRHAVAIDNRLSIRDILRLGADTWARERHPDRPIRNGVRLDLHELLDNDLQEFGARRARTNDVSAHHNISDILATRTPDADRA
ncbi:hypothetical protein ACIP5Y_12750 [Nocardia sp. NPDC088792]|uniref:hypothetical protein n=1 Tax=Nocardia sp. NPDC088792 TaxID=3364332 RepID=UPI0037F2B05A